VGAKRLRQRLDDLAAAPSLAAMRALPGGCHELRGDLAGLLALKLDGGRRLVIKPNHNPTPAKDDGGLDWTKVTKIVVTAIEDYLG
jgi:plasmid maintenance system killer protein